MKLIESPVKGNHVVPSLVLLSRIYVPHWRRYP
jgi:hypothetical protein